MTAVDLAARPAPARASALARILSVFRLHFANPTIVVWMPLAILAVIFLLNWAIWWLLYTYTPAAELEGGVSEGTQWSGASSFAFIYMLVVAIQSMNATFALALGFGATRRDYYLGSALTFVVLAAGWSVLFGLLGWIEEATGGWGLGGRMFTAIYFGEDGPLLRMLYVFLLFLFFLFLGSLSGALFVRWKSFGVTALYVGIGVLLVGGAALLFLTEGWLAFWEALVSLGFGGVYVLTLVPTAIAAIAGFFVLRGATPRS